MDRETSDRDSQRQGKRKQGGDSSSGSRGDGRPRRRRRRRSGGGGEGGGRSPEARESDAPRDEPGKSSRRRRRRKRRDDEGGGQRQESRPSRGRGGGGGGGRSRRGRKTRGGDRREKSDKNLLPARDPFVELVSIDPDERIDLETDSEKIEMRVVDLITPIGKGQRGLIVAPPKTGKTTLLMQLAEAIALNHPEIELIIALIDERPEEVTAFKRAGFGEVWASSNDEPTRRHLNLTRQLADHARKRVLDGADVVVLLDSITRMARAHNVGQSGSHRTLSGGLDARALEKPKRFFGSARNVADGGSLTILATALIDTGSRQDEVIFQEFKGTGNMELQLDRRLAERRIWPAIDIVRSGTRKEEKLFEADEYPGVVALRRALAGQPPVEAMQLMLSRIGRYNTNREFLLEAAKAAAAI